MLKFNINNCSAFIKINLNDYYKSNLIISKNGNINISKSFLDNEPNIIQLYNEIKSCHYFNGNLYLGNELKQLIVFDIGEKTIFKIIDGFNQPINYITSCLDILCCSTLTNKIFFISLIDYRLILI